MALGSIRQPTATVDSQFFSRLTALNTILIGQNKKKYNRNGASGIETTSIGSSAINLADAVPAEKPVGSASGKAERGRPPKRVQESSSEIASLSVSKKQRATSLIPDIVVDTTVSRPTEGSLRLLPLRIPTDLISTGIGRHSNKINWNLYWNMWFPENEDHYFTPFSVDTHDLNLLVLQGNKRVYLYYFRSIYYLAIAYNLCTM